MMVTVKPSEETTVERRKNGTLKAILLSPPPANCYSLKNPCTAFCHISG